MEKTEIQPAIKESIITDVTEMEDKINKQISVNTNII